MFFVVCDIDTQSSLLEAPLFCVVVSDFEAFVKRLFLVRFFLVARRWPPPPPPPPRPSTRFALVDDTKVDDGVMTRHPLSFFCGKSSPKKKREKKECEHPKP